MPLFKPKENFTYSLFVSLKSSSIDVQLVKISQNGKREVLLCERTIFFLENSQDPHIYIQAYIKHLDQTLNKNQLAVHKLINNTHINIVFILYTPWFTSHIDSLFFKEEVVLNEKFIDNELAKKQTSTDLKLLEKHIIKIETNGYTLTDIHDLVCSNVKINTYSSFISKETYTTLIKTARQYFPKTKKILCKTSPMVLVQIINQLMVREDNVLFINITGEITEVGIIEDDALVQFATFPTGIHDFIRATSTTIKSYDYDILYQKQIALKSQTDSATFDRLKQKWIQTLIQTLTYSKQHIPSKIVLLGHYKVLDFFASHIKETSITESGQIFKNHRIINFDISLVKDILTYKTPIGEQELDLQLEALM